LKNQCDMQSQRVCRIHFYPLLHLKQFFVQLSMKGSFSHRNTRQQGHRVISASRVIILSMTVRFRSHIISKSELNNTAKSFTKNKRSMSSTIERDRNYCIFLFEHTCACVVWRISRPYHVDQHSINATIRYGGVHFHMLFSAPEFPCGNMELLMANHSRGYMCTCDS
jgi:hypothetical protein